MSTSAHPITRKPAVRPRRRVGGSSTGTTRRATVKRTRHVETVLDDSNCIDLTRDEAYVVDLTSPNDTAPISLHYQSTSRVTCRPRRRARLETIDDTAATPSRPISICLLDDFDQNDMLPEVDFGQYSRTYQSESQSGACSNTREISCPICFDSDQEIAKSGRHLMSTTCGHVFCNNCISESIHNNRCCPTCRKRLTTRQIHQIFL